MTSAPKILAVLRVSVGVAMCGLGAFLFLGDLPNLNWGLPVALVVWGGMLIFWSWADGHLRRSDSERSAKDPGRFRAMQKLRAWARLGWLVIVASLVCIYISATASGGGVLGAVLFLGSLAIGVVGVTLCFLPLLYARVTALHPADDKGE